MRWQPALFALLVLCVAGVGCGDDGNNGTNTTSPTTSAGGGGVGGAGGSSSTGLSTDDDGDGFSENDGDCDDNDPNVHPDAQEVCDDNIDNNCNGATDSQEPDGDGDGFGPCAGDCNDGDPTIHPSAPEIDLDQVDNNCDGVIDADFDGDGFTEAMGDCDDSDDMVYPGAVEICLDGVDNDCNGFIDIAEPDMDGDGYGPCDGDCDDTDPTIGPGQPEIDGDGIDNNCDNLVDLDIDGDGWTTSKTGTARTTTPLINPAAIEDCNDGVDNNCNGEIGHRLPDPVRGCGHRQRSSVGCVYYAVDTNPLQSEPQKAVAISNIDTAVSRQRHRRSEERRQLGQTISGGYGHRRLRSHFQTVNHPPPQHQRYRGLRAGGAYRITSGPAGHRLPVQSDQRGVSSFLSDASLLCCPSRPWTSFYITPGWPYGRDISNVLRRYAPADRGDRGRHHGGHAHQQHHSRRNGTERRARRSNPGVVRTPWSLQEGDFLQVTVAERERLLRGQLRRSRQAHQRVHLERLRQRAVRKLATAAASTSKRTSSACRRGARRTSERAPRSASAEQVGLAGDGAAQQAGTVVTFDANVTGHRHAAGQHRHPDAAGETKSNTASTVPLQHPGDFLVTASDPILVDAVHRRLLHRAEQRWLQTVIRVRSRRFRWSSSSISTSCSCRARG